MITATDPSNSISISVGRGDTIETTATDIKYRKRFAVTVSDTNGKPVQGAFVTVKVSPLAFIKGSFDSAGVRTVADICPNEDTNKNNILDPGEDKNGNGELDPRISRVVAGAEGGNQTTDSQGIVYVIAEWAKSDAAWIGFNLEFSTTGKAGATEVTVVSPNTTSYAEGDDTKPSSAFKRSPFGVNAGCNNLL